MNAFMLMSERILLPFINPVEAEIIKVAVTTKVTITHRNGELSSPKILLRPPERFMILVPIDVAIPSASVYNETESIIVPVRPFILSPKRGANVMSIAEEIAENLER